MTRFYPMLLLVALLSLLGRLAVAQPTPSCIGFNSTPIGTIFTPETGYGADSVVTFEAGVPVSLQPFTYLDGTTDLWGATVLANQFNVPFGAGAVASLGNANLAFDFSQLGHPVNSVCFDFIEGGGELNLRVNNGTILVLNNFSQLLSSPALPLPAGITVSIDYDNPNSFLPTGTLCLSGPIQSLWIGGQELQIDNICYNPAPSSGCGISNVVVTPQPCTPNGIYFAQVNFAHTAANGQFNIVGNGQSYGPFSFASLPVSIGPFVPGTVYNLSIVSSVNDNCQVPFTVVAACLPSCAPSGLTATAVSCSPGGGYNVLVDFDSTPGTAVQTYTATVDGQIVATFTSAQLPFLIENVQPATDALQFELTVCRATPPNPNNCCASTLVDIITCPPPSDCSFSAISLQAVECSPSGSFYVRVSTNSPQNAPLNTLLYVNGELFWQHGGGPVFVVGPFQGPTGDSLLFELVACWTLPATPARCCHPSVALPPTPVHCRRT